VADSGGTPLIWVRPLDSSAAQPLPGTEGASGIFWSPDSQHIGFFAQGQLKKVATRGGPPQMICNVERGTGSQGAWGTDDVILIGNNLANVLMRVTAAGGQPTPATEVLSKERHHYPSFFPDGRHFLYVAVSGSQFQERLWYVGSLDSKERYPLPGLTGQAGEVTYSPTGHVLFVRGTTLIAQPFDLRRFELFGDAVPVAEQVIEPVPAFSISSNGSLAYLSGGVDSELAWFDRTGRRLGLAGPKGHYLNPELSPDGKFVAFTRGLPPDLWVRDIERGLDTRLTSHAAADYTPIWSPDMQTLAFFSQQERGTLFSLAVGVIGEGTSLLEGLFGATPADWSRDGHTIIYEYEGDVWALPDPAMDSKPLRVTQSSFRETNPRLSPDGRWIAYASNQSGEREDVYIQPFQQPGLQQPVSIAGGRTPHWSADGKELFYIAPDLWLMAVPIATVGTSLRVGTPIRLFPTGMSMHTGGLGRNYNVARDGRFLINVSTTDLSAAPITVVLSWDAALKK
jgi:Tol biopolymer transport system component